ncbi:MAG: MTH1187 family thiamine-binding protein [ANME-2 cluster archaeon]|nr:MTH1187 family thiamine-binding protein [ANME-2 cluster archaeon]
MTELIITAQLQLAVLGEGDSLSRYISTAVKALDEHNVQYQICPMGTAIQAGSIDEIFDACKAAHKAVMDMGVNRVLTSITIDHRLQGCKGLNEKVRSVKLKM